MFLKENYKKIVLTLFVAVTFFGISYSVKSLTLADIELLIGLGIIPAQNAETARNFLNQKNSTAPGEIIKSDLNSEAECLVINQNLIKGQSGSVVSALQKFLKSEGFFPDNQEITSYYGDVTFYAVADFQIATGLVKNRSQIGAGNIGAITRSKIQEVSCKKISEATTPVVTTIEVATTTSLIATTTTSKKIKTPELIKPSSVSMQDYIRYENEETGELSMKYEVNIQPVNGASYLEVVAVCDPSALTLTSSYVKECGEVYVVKPVVKGRKTISIIYKNNSRIIQSVTFGIEAFDANKKSLGLAELSGEVPSEKPVINLNINGSTESQIGIGPIKNQVCSRNQQLDFIRYTMTPYDPLQPVSLPICYPGELLCDSSYPPTYCKITLGPSSDDLCIKSQKFVNGKCVPRID